MKVLALVPHELEHTPGQRLRIERWGSLLTHQVGTLDYIPFASRNLTMVMYQPRRYLHKLIATIQAASQYLRRIQQLNLDSYDVAFIYREATLVGPPLVERYLSRKGLPYVYDFDDAIFLPLPSQRSPIFTLGRWYSKVSEICRNSAHIIVGNTYLKRYANQLNANVSIIPIGMSIDTIVPRAEYATSAPLVIGWTGSFSTAPYVEALYPVLRQLQAEFGCVIRTIGAPAAPASFDLAIDRRTWHSTREISDIQSFDIGINPMPINDWTKGKGTGKTLQYMSVGIPCIVSPAGSNLDIVQHGINGFLAHSNADWYAYLRQLICDIQLRRTIGLAGRQTVEQQYNIRDHAAQFVAILQHVAQKRR